MMPIVLNLNMNFNVDASGIGNEPMECLSSL